MSFEENPIFEEKVNLNLEVGQLLKLALDWKTDDTYKEIDFDLIKMRWRCQICFKAKMQNFSHFSLNQITVKNVLRFFQKTLTRSDDRKEKFGRRSKTKKKHCVLSTYRSISSKTCYWIISVPSA